MALKKLTVALAMVMAASLTGCSSASDTANSPDTTTSASDTSTPAPSSGDTTDASTTAPSDIPTTAATSSAAPATGADPSSQYCTELRSAKAQFDNLNFQTLSVAEFQRLTSEFDSLAAIAPDEVKDDWTTLSGALRQVQQILADVGLTFDDLKSLSSGQLPPGVSVQQLKKLTQQLQTFASDSRFQTASAAITAHAKTECGITMGG